MNIRFICEHCGGELSIEDYLANQQIECYHCKAPVVVPDARGPTIIEFSCLGCGTAFRVPAARMGTRSTCPKCGAVLVVPGNSTSGPPAPAPTAIGTAPAPEPVYEEDLPVIPSRVARHTGPPGTRQPAGTPAQQPQGEQGLYVPQPSRGVNPGWIVFWAVLAIVVVIAGWMVFAKSGTKDPYANYVDLTGRVSVGYNGNLDVFTFTNVSNPGRRLTNLKMTLTADGKDYTCQIGQLAPGDNEFKVDGTAFKTEAGQAFSAERFATAQFVLKANIEGMNKPGVMTGTWRRGGSSEAPEEPAKEKSP